MREFTVKLDKPTVIKEFDLYSDEKVYKHYNFTLAAIFAKDENTAITKINKYYPGISYTFVSNTSNYCDFVWRW